MLGEGSGALVMCDDDDLDEYLLDVPQGGYQG